MSSSGEWLPELIFLDKYENSWDQYLDALYSFFYQDFVASKPFNSPAPPFFGKRFALKRYPLTKDKNWECTFWHFISEGPKEKSRLLDIHRCERILWPRPIIEAAATESIQVKWWRNTRGNKDNILIALKDFSYLVILVDKSDYILPWTTYCVEQRHRREKLRREYEEYKAKNS